MSIDPDKLAAFEAWRQTDKAAAHRRALRRRRPRPTRPRAALPAARPSSAARSNSATPSSSRLRRSSPTPPAAWAPRRRRRSPAMPGTSARATPSSSRNGPLSSTGAMPSTWPRPSSRGCRPCGRKSTPPSRPSSAIRGGDFQCSDDSAAGAYAKKLGDAHVAAAKAALTDLMTGTHEPGAVADAIEARCGGMASAIADAMPHEIRQASNYFAPK